ncbi:hypothetical protein ORJ04_18560 [Rheinheimera baltica]|uniref:Uncharacterized protein n=1 Tax=Rheinheimera baltica TaxID=67576 RepID=A0ABT9I4U0_9GAMM|nr:hypothetical protein [Rheinheimera baltica]MDP5137956.1 hypothetical protein [Rheinheimera baltica]
MRIDIFNKDWIKAFHDNSKKIVKSGVLSGMKKFIQNDGAYLIKLLPFPLVFEKNEYERLVSAAKKLTTSQTKIIDYLCKKNSKEYLLDIFGIPKELQEFINWEELVTNKYQISRFDIVPSNNGYKFCEFNFGSNVGASEDFYLFEKYLRALSLDVAQPKQSPYYKKALLLKKLVDTYDIENIVILINSKYRYLGYVSSELLERHIKEILPEVTITTEDETTYPKKLLCEENGCKTLVYQQFLMNDIAEHKVFFGELLASKAQLICSLTANIRTNKYWFSIFHQLQYQKLLDSDEIEIINKYIPYTFKLSNQNVEHALLEKDVYVFKKNNSLGGGGILIGNETEADVLINELYQTDIDEWTAQELVNFNGIKLPYSIDGTDELSNIVFGLFLIGNSAIGMDVRASNSSKVVNVSTGSYSGWAFPVSEKKKKEILNELVQE